MKTSTALALAGAVGVAFFFLERKASAASTAAPGATTPSGHPAIFDAADKGYTDFVAGVGNAAHIPGASTLAKWNPVHMGIAIGDKIAPYTTPVLRNTASAVKSATKSTVHVLSFGLL